MNIVHVIPTLSRGGAERIVVDLANASTDAGDKVSVVIAVGHDDDLRGQLRAGIDLREIQQGRSVLSSYSRLIPWLVRQRHWIFAQDVIHCHLTFGSVLGMLVAAMRSICRSAKPALVETYHAVGMPISKVDRAIHALLLRGRDAVALMALDSYWSRQMNRARVPVRVIPNGVKPPQRPPAAAVAEYRKQLDVPDGVCIVGTVSRLVPARRPDTVLEIFARVARLVDNRVVFLIAGEGSERERLERSIGLLGLGKQIRLPGLAREPALAFATIDCYLTLNVGPITGVAALEAASSGVVVSAYQMRNDYDGTGDWIWSSHNVNAVAARLAELVDHPARRFALAERQRAVVAETLNVEKMADAYRQFYARAIEHRSKP